MNHKAALEKLFKPALSKAEIKAEVTDRTARAITDADTAQREAKTARLRSARLEMEAKQAAVAETAKSTMSPPKRRTKRTQPSTRTKASRV